MTSFYVICGLGLPHSKILGSLINRRSPEKIFKDLFFRRTLAAVSLVLGLGLEHSCPWPREVLSSKRLSLALASSIPVLGLERFCPRKGCPWPWPRIFFVSLALASSLVSSTPPLLVTDVSTMQTSGGSRKFSWGGILSTKPQKFECVFTKIESNFSAEIVTFRNGAELFEVEAVFSAKIVTFRLVGGDASPPSPPLNPPLMQTPI